MKSSFKVKLQPTSNRLVNNHTKLFIQNGNKPIYLGYISTGGGQWHSFWPDAEPGYITPGKRSVGMLKNKQSLQGFQQVAKLSMYRNTQLSHDIFVYYHPELDKIGYRPSYVAL